MIKKLTVSNYKAFGSESSELKILPLTIIVGKNNSGKSSLLKLLSILSTMSTGRVTSPLLLSNDVVSLGGKYQDLFHNNDTSELQFILENSEGQKLKIKYTMNQSQLFQVSENGSGKSLTMNFGKDNPFSSNINNLKSQGEENNPFQFTTLYLGPLRPMIERETRIGGENFEKLVKNGANVDEVLLQSFSTDKKIFNEVSFWLSDNLECTGLNFERNSESSGSYSLSVRHGNAIVNLADVGQGIGQVLPVIVSSYMDNSPDITIVEQPVLHLHPAAHQAVAQRLAESAIKMKRNYIIETHSYNFILALRDMIANSNNPLSDEDVIIYSVEQDKDESWLKEITINKKGELSDWPEGVFAESFEILRSIKSHRDDSTVK